MDQQSKPFALPKGLLNGLTNADSHESQLHYLSQLQSVMNKPSAAKPAATSSGSQQSQSRTNSRATNYELLTGLGFSAKECADLLPQTEDSKQESNNICSESAKPKEAPPKSPKGRSKGQPQDPNPQDPDPEDNPPSAEQMVTVGPSQMHNPPKYNLIRACASVVCAGLSWQPIKNWALTTLHYFQNYTYRLDLSPSVWLKPFLPRSYSGFIPTLRLWDTGIAMKVPVITTQPWVPLANWFGRAPRMFVLKANLMKTVRIEFLSRALLLVRPSRSDVIKSLLVASILPLAAYLLWPSPNNSANSSGCRVPKAVYSHILGACQAQAVYTARTPETLLSLKNLVLRLLVEDETVLEACLDKQQEAVLVTHVPALAMIPSDEEDRCRQMMETHNRKLWRAFNYSRKGVSSLMTWLTGRSLPR